MNSRKNLARLFSQIGGQDALRSILRDFYDRMSKDVLIGYFFANRDVFLIADKQFEFLMFAMGQAESYSGKPPHAAHLELPTILRGHFDRRLVILRETLEHHQVPASQIKIWLDFEKAFRAVVQT